MFTLKTETVLPTSPVVSLMSVFALLHVVRQITFADADADIYKPLSVTFSSLTLYSDRVLGTIAVHQSFPLVSVDDNKTIHYHGDFATNVSKTDPEVIFLSSQKHHLNETRRMLHVSQDQFGVSYECLFQPTLSKCIVRYTGNGTEVRRIIREFSGESGSSATGIDELADRVSSMLSDTLGKNARHIYDRWSGVYESILRVSRPDDMEMIFKISRGRYRFVYCTVWSPAPLPFRVTLMGKGLRPVSSTAFHGMTHNMAIVSNSTSSSSVLSELECEVSSSVGWTISLKNPLRGGISRKLTEGSASGRTSDSGELHVVATIVAVATLTIVKAMMCAFFVFKRDARYESADETESVTVGNTYEDPYVSFHRYEVECEAHYEEPK